MSQAKVFNLDSLEMTWEEFRKRHARHAADTKWLEEFKALLKEVSGNADEFLLAGNQVAVLRPGNLNQKRLAAEQPNIITRYTRPVVETKFDTEAFREEMPELYEQYRARGLVLADKPSFEGI